MRTGQNCNLVWRRKINNNSNSITNDLIPGLNMLRLYKHREINILFWSFLFLHYLFFFSILCPLSVGHAVSAMIHSKNVYTNLQSQYSKKCQIVGKERFIALGRNVDGWFWYLWPTMAFQWWPLKFILLSMLGASGRFLFTSNCKLFTEHPASRWYLEWW